MSRLSSVMKLQAVVFAGYAVLFLVAPDFTVDTIFGWANQPTIWIRAVGVPFAGLALLAWLVATKLDTRLDLVWPLALVPALFVVVFVGERIAGTYEGSDRFFWASLAVTVFFSLTVGGLRMAVTAPETETSPTKDQRVPV